MRIPHLGDSWEMIMRELPGATRSSPEIHRLKRASLRGLSGLPALSPATSRQGSDIMQIFEGTNQIQRLVISRGLAR